MDCTAMDQAIAPKRSYRRPDTALLWVRFARDQAPSVRHALAEAYDPFARMLAAKAYARRAYSSMEHEEYLQTARLALLEAIDRYDPAQGAMFETFATQRITGAMLDALEQSSEVQGQIAARRRVLSARVAALTDNQPVDGDVFSRLAEIAVGLAVGLMLEDTGMHVDDTTLAADSYTGVELRQLRARLVGLVRDLPERQRMVISGHYQQHRPFEEIAAALGVTKGRVSQIHKEALENLRKRLASPDGIDLRC
jgi:RNA polymerase sigma factor for flagellar operon FliA